MSSSIVSSEELPAEEESVGTVQPLRPQNYRTDRGMGRYVGFNGIVAPQRESELLEFIDLMLDHNVHSYLEIGLERGITFHTLGSRLPKGVRCVGVDKPIDARITGGPEMVATVCTDLVFRGKFPTIIWGDSSSSKIVEAVKKLGPYDLVFIDGDHSLAGVTKDWNNFGKLGRIVAFHDIKYDWEDAGVHILWDQIKQEYPGQTVEILGAQGEYRPGMGIGVFFREK